jgi:hypothetical protein
MLLLPSTADKVGGGVFEELPPHPASPTNPTAATAPNQHRNIPIAARLCAQLRRKPINFNAANYSGFSIPPSVLLSLP